MKDSKIMITLLLLAGMLCISNSLGFENVSDVTQFYQQNLVGGDDLNFQVIDGYLPIDWYYNQQMYNTSLFFELVTKQGEVLANTSAETPVIFWSEGGPGCSSQFSFFTGHGPFYVDDQQNLHLRSTSWNKLAHIIYVDQPLNTGFSYSNAPGSVMSTQQATDNFINFLYNFYSYPEFQLIINNPTYIMSYSYGGHYAPAFASALVQTLHPLLQQINFKGIAIGDGWVNPYNQLPFYSTYTYSISISSLNQSMQYNQEQLEGLQYLQENSYQSATQIFDTITNQIGQNSKVDIYNYEFQQEPTNSYNEFLNNPANMKSLNIYPGIPQYQDCNMTIYQAFDNDISQSFQSDLEFLLQQGVYKVLIYQGQLDIIVSTPSVQNFINQLKYLGNWKHAQKQIWQLNGQTVGTIKNNGTFTFAEVYGAGHMVPRDQPAPMYDLLNRFLSNSWNTSIPV